MTSQGETPTSPPASAPASAPSTGDQTPLPAPGSPASAWGRVDETGTVFVRTPDGERAVGQYPEGSPEEALAFFTRRFDALALEVQLLEQRVHAGTLTPDEAATSVRRSARRSVESNAVGDVVGLAARLDALMPLIAVQRGKRREEKARKVEESRVRKNEIVTEAERISQSKDWRNGVNRLRDLLEEWKALPRIDKPTDEELWHRFSSAAHAVTPDGARPTSPSSTSSARAPRWSSSVCSRRPRRSSGSTDWGPTSARYRSLMQEWKAAGSAPREVEEKLWRRFREIQDGFFGAREAANAEQDREFAANAEVKKQLLVEAEALLPVTDLDAAKRTFRDIAEQLGRRRQGPARPDQVARGPHPQGRAGDPLGRGRPVEAHATPRSRRGPTTCSASSSGRSAGLEADLEKARSNGDRARRSPRLEENLASRQQSFLEMARRGRHRVRLSDPCPSTPAARAGDPVGVEDAVDLADGLEDGAEVLGVAHLEGEPALGHAVAGGAQAGREDVHVLVGEHHGDVGEQPGAVERLHHDLDQEGRLRGRRPLHVGEPLGLAEQLRWRWCSPGGAPRCRPHG